MTFQAYVPMMLRENESMENDEASHHGSDSEPPVTSVFMQQACIPHFTRRPRTAERRRLTLKLHSFADFIWITMGYFSHPSIRQLIIVTVLLPLVFLGL